MKCFDYDGDGFLKNNKSEIKKTKKLSEFYKKFGTLPLAEEKASIGLLRFILGFDTFYEEVNQLELHRILAKEKEQKTSATTTLRGSFTIPKSNVQTGSLHQQICNTAKK